MERKKGAKVYNMTSYVDKKECEVHMHLYVCIHIKYLWEDTQEIGNDGCLYVGVFESGGEN